MLRIEHGFDHRPGHDRKPRHEMHRPAAGARDREAGDLVVRVVDDRGALRKFAHLQPVQIVGGFEIDRLAAFAGHFQHALADLLPRFRMQGQRYAERRRGALAGVIIRRRPDAAAGKHDVAAGQRPSQRRRDARRIVAQVFSPRELQSARLEDREHLGEVLVFALAGEDFIADDDQTECHLFPVGWTAVEKGDALVDATFASSARWRSSACRQ